MYFRIGTEPDKNPFAALARALEPLTGERGLADKLEDRESISRAKGKAAAMTATPFGTPTKTVQTNGLERQASSTL